jgi:beta-N-acetylhexosaminidase
LNLADSADIVVVGSYLSTSSTTSSATAPDAIAQFVRDMVARKPGTIVVAFGSPYFLRQIPAVSTYLVAWGGFPVSQRAAAQALVGVAAITGRLPISIPPVLSFGTGEQRSAVIRSNTSPRH